MSDLAELTEALRERGFGIAHSVRLTDFGNQKIVVIKAVRELTGWGLKDTKDAVEALATILDSVTPEQAADAAARLQAAGAQVEIGVSELQLYAFDPVDPRRGEQPIERLRVSNSGLALERGRLGVWALEPIDWLPSEHLLATVDEHRYAWTKAGKQEAATEMQIVASVSARHPTLEARLRSADLETRQREAAIYGDWLQTQGDPRGLIAAAALALDEAPQDRRRRDELEQLISSHASHLLGRALELLRKAECTWVGPVLDTLAFERTTDLHEYEVPLPRKQLEQLLALPICACLRSLILERPVDGDAMLGEQLAAAACAPGLRELRLEHVGNLDLQGDAFARLEALTIQGRFKLGPLRMPALRSLDVSIVVPLAPLAASFVQLDTPALEHFSMAITTYEYWDQNYGPLQDNVFELLTQPAFARLKTLTISGDPMMIGLADLLARLPAIATLERLDLRASEMSDECRAELERSRDRLPGLLL